VRLALRDALGETLPLGELLVLALRDGVAELEVVTDTVEGCEGVMDGVSVGDGVGVGALP